MKQALSVMCMLLLAALFAGCGEAPAPENVTQEESAATPKPEKIVLKYANFPPAPSFPCVQMEQWKKVVEERTNGRVEVQTFPGSTLLNPKNMVDGVVAGTAEVGCFAMSYLPGRFPVSASVDLPVGFQNAKAASLTLYDLIEQYQPEEFESVKVLTLFTCPPASIMTRDPVRNLEELQGVPLRVSGTGVPVIRAMGGKADGMPMSETAEAIQKGRVKGIVSSMEILKDFNFAAYCPNALRTNLHVVTFAVIMNQQVWDALPADVQQVLDDLSREHALWTGTYVDEHVEEALAWAGQEYDHQVFVLPEKEQARLPELFQPIIDTYIENTNAAGLPAEQILTDMRALKQKHEATYPE